MALVWLMRHAEAQKASGQSEEDLFSVGDLGLSPRGVTQAEAARERLAGESFDGVYASPLRRAVETARIVAGREPSLDARLAELPVGRGSYEDVLGAILELPHRFEAGEDALAMERSAFADALGEIALRHENALVVAHGLANRAFLCRARELPMSQMLAIEQEHAHVTRCARAGTRWIA